MIPIGPWPSEDALDRASGLAYPSTPGIKKLDFPISANSASPLFGGTALMPTGTDVRSKFRSRSKACNYGPNEQQ